MDNKIEKLEKFMESLIEKQIAKVGEGPFNYNEVLKFKKESAMISSEIAILEKKVFDEAAGKIANYASDILKYLFEFRLNIIKLSGGLNENEELTNPFELEKVKEFINGEDAKGENYLLKEELDKFIKNMNVLNSKFNFKTLAPENFSDEPFAGELAKELSFTDLFRFSPAFSIYILTYELENKIINTQYKALKLLLKNSE